MYIYKYSFLNNNEENGGGWVLKAPFTTNCHYIRYLKTINAVVDAIVSANAKLFCTIPYVMLQPCMQNRQEYKVVMYNEVVQYVSSNSRHAIQIVTSSGSSSSFGIV